MNRLYLSAAAVFVLLAAACTPKLSITPTSMPATAPAPMPDLTALLPWPNGKPFYVKAGLLGPVAWQSVLPFGTTYPGGVAYLVEFLDADKRVLQSFKGEFETPLNYTARENELKVDIGTIVLANGQQMLESLNADPRFNKRYLIPSGAEYVRFTVDPDRLIAERNETNNSLEFRLPKESRPSGNTSSI